MNRFDVSVYAIRRRAGRHRPFEVRWHAAGRSRSKSFITRRLADSYRAELVRAARTGLEFDPLTAEPAAWNLPEPATVTWYQEATAYAAMKWPSVAAHSRASLAEPLATVTPVLTRPGARDRPGPRELRTVSYRHAFHPARPAGPGSAAAHILDWAQPTSLPVGCLSEPAVLRTAYDLRHAALSLRLSARGDPAQIAARAGNSVAVLLTVYSRCIHGHEELLSQQIGRVLGPSAGPGPCPSVEKPAVAPTARRARTPSAIRPWIPRPARRRPLDHAGTKRPRPETVTTGTASYPDQGKY